MAGSDVDVELFRSLEQALHRPEVRGSREAAAALLADGFIEFGSSGRVFDRAVVIEALAGETSAAPSPLPEILDFAVRALAHDTVLVTYRSVRRAFGGAEERTVLRSSIWKQSGDKWQMLFHQGTVVPLPP